MIVITLLLLLLLLLLSPFGYLLTYVISAFCVANSIDFNMILCDVFRVTIVWLDVPIRIHRLHIADHFFLLPPSVRFNKLFKR